jgi:hypothetical protein
MAQQPDTLRSPENGGLLGSGLAVATGLFRLVPHLPNFTPVGALGLFAGARMRLWHALTLPLLVMAVSDLLLQSFYGLSPFHPFVYASVVANVMLGRLLLRRSGSPWRIGGVSLLASAQFFLVTNFGVWMTWPMYTRDLAGLLQCYVAAIPFFQYTLLGDLVFCGVMFGAYALAARWSVASQATAPRLQTDPAS